MSILALATILLWIAVYYELNKPSEKKKRKKNYSFINFRFFINFSNNDLSYSKAFCLKIFLVTGVVFNKNRGSQTNRVFSILVFFNI